MFLNLGVVSPLSSPFGVTALLLLLLLLFILLTFFGDANDDPSLLPLVLVSPIFGGVSSISNFIFCPTFTGAFNASFIHFCMLTGLLRAVPASVFFVVFSSSGVVVAACRDPSSLVKYVAIGVAYPLPVVSFLFLFDSDLLVVVVVVVFFFFRFSTFGVEGTLDIRKCRRPPFWVFCCCFFPLLSSVVVVLLLVFFKVFSFGVLKLIVVVVIGDDWLSLPKGISWYRSDASSPLVVVAVKGRWWCWSRRRRRSCCCCCSPPFWMWCWEMIELDTFDPLLVLVFVKCDVVVVVVVVCERRLYRIVLLDEDPPPVKGFWSTWWCLVGMFLVSSLYEREREKERDELNIKNGRKWREHFLD